MSVITLPQRSQPSYTQGFARSAAESVAPNLWKGLVGAWVPALGPTGGTLYDVSGGKNHGTLTDMDPATDWVVGEKGYALDFDGVTGTCVRVVGSGIVRTVGGWWYRDPDLYDYLWDDRGGGGSGYFYCDSGNTTLVKSSGTSYVDGKVATSMTLNAWHWVVWQPTTALSLSTFYLGASNLSFHVFKGYMGPQMAWDRTLSPNEIQQLYIDPLAPFRLRRWVPVSTAAAPSFAGSNLVLGGGVF